MENLEDIVREYYNEISSLTITHDLDDVDDYELNGKLGEVMDTDLFRFSEFENYNVVKNLYNT